MRKKVFVLVLIFGLVGVASAQSDQSLACGDLNGDGLVNIVDALLLVNYYVGTIGGSNIHISKADVNSDGAINVTDALLIAQSYVGIGIELKCPEPVLLINDLQGDWVIDSYVNLELDEDRYIYDFNVDEWTADVTLSGAVEDFITVDSQVSLSHRPAQLIAYIGKIIIETEADVYPQYKFDLLFTGHYELDLSRITVEVKEDENSTLTFGVDPNYYVDFLWTKQAISLSLSDIPCLEGDETLSLDFDIQRDTTLLLPAGKHKLPYDYYDILSKFEIINSSFRASFIIESDMLLNVNGTVLLSGLDVTVSYSSSPTFSKYLSGPIVFSAVPEEDNYLLERQVSEPGRKEIAEYFGLSEADIVNHEYHQTFAQVVQ